MVNASEGVMRRPFDCAQGRPSGRPCLSFDFAQDRLLAICPQDRRQAQKGKVLWPGLPRESQAALDTEPGVKHRPNVAQSGYTERWNPLVALRRLS
jgi:hypothetical protein